jgi:hypothetical protein
MRKTENVTLTVAVRPCGLIWSVHVGFWTVYSSLVPVAAPKRNRTPKITKMRLEPIFT